MNKFGKTIAQQECLCIVTPFGRSSAPVRAGRPHFLVLAMPKPRGTLGSARLASPNVAYLETLCEMPIFLKKMSKRVKTAVDIK